MNNISSLLQQEKVDQPHQHGGQEQVSRSSEGRSARNCLKDGMGDLYRKRGKRWVQWFLGVEKEVPTEDQEGFLKTCMWEGESWRRCQGQLKDKHGQLS